MKYTVYIEEKAYRVISGHIYNMNTDTIIPGDLLFHSSPLGMHLFIVDKIDSVCKFFKAENGSVVTLESGSWRITKNAMQYFEFSCCSFPTEAELRKYLTLKFGICIS